MIRINGPLIDFFQVTWRKKGLLLHFVHTSPVGRLVVREHTNTIRKVPLNINSDLEKRVAVLWSWYDAG